ncbi:MAG TPA: hypothetical protein VF590_03585 [Isosphaeraceae bacterium]
MAVIVLACAVWLGWRSVRRRQSARATPPTPAPPEVEASMAGWSALARRALMVRFGPAWGAKTTEEIAAEPELAEALGPERAEQLVRFLRAADRARFAGEPAGAAHGPDWADWVAAFVGEAGAMSRISGK